MAKRKQRIVPIEDSPSVDRSNEKLCKEYEASIKEKINKIEALKPLFLPQGIYAAPHLDIHRIKNIFITYDLLLKSRQATLERLYCLLDWTENRKVVDIEVLNAIKNDYHVESIASIFNVIITKETRAEALLREWLAEIETIIKTLDTQLEASKQQKLLLEKQREAIKNSNTVVQFSEQLNQFTRTINALSEDFPHKHTFIQVKNELEQKFAFLLANETEIGVVNITLSIYAKKIIEQENAMGELAKSANLAFLDCVKILSEELAKLQLFMNDTGVDRHAEHNALANTLALVKKPRFETDLVALDLKVLSDIRESVEKERDQIRKAHQRNKDISDDCRVVKTIIKEISKERGRISHKSVVLAITDPREKILKNLEFELTQNVLQYANPENKKRFIQAVLNTLHTQLNEKILHDLTDAIANPCWGFLRKILQPFYLFLKNISGTTYTPQFFSSQTEENIARIAQNAEYQLQQILTHLDQVVEEQAVKLMPDLSIV